MSPLSQTHDKVDGVGGGGGGAVREGGDMNGKVRAASVAPRFPAVPNLLLV